jgi:hypothetical protein
MIFARADFVNMLRASHREPFISLCHCRVESKTGRIRCVKYWQTALAILAALSASFALAEDFKTVNGKEYKNAAVSRVEPDGIVLKTKSGIANVYFTELPKEVQERFHYEDPEAAVHAVEQPAPTPDNNAPTAEQSGATEESSPAVREKPPSPAQSNDAWEQDDKLKAVMNSPQMQKAQNSEEQIAVIKNTDLYKRGYAKQSTAVKITVSDAERDFAYAHSGLQRELALPVNLIAQAGLEEIQKHQTLLTDLMTDEARARNRLFELYALIMKDGE